MKVDNGLLLLLIMITSSFYTTTLPVSPVYITLPVVLFVTGYFIFLKSRNIINLDLFFFGLGIAIYSVILSIFNSSNYTWPIVVNLLLAVFSFILLACTSFKVSKSELSVSISKYSIFIIIYVSIDTLLRFLYPISNELYNVEGSDIWFYKYKASYILGDSNAVALLLLGTVFFLFYMCEKALLEVNKVTIFKIILLIVLLILTFSRAAYLALFIGLIYYLFKRYRELIHWCMVLSLVLIGVFTNKILIFLNSDGSGSQKAKELLSVFDFFGLSYIDIAFGTGFGLGNTISGVYIHGLLVKSLIEGGAFFLFLLVCLFTIIICKNKSILIFLLPVIISSFSLSFYIIAPFQGVIMGVILLSYRLKL